MTFHFPTMYTTKIEQQTQLLFFFALSLAIIGSLYRFTTWPGHGSMSRYVSLAGLFLVFFRFLAVLYSMPIKNTLIVLILSPFVLYTCTKVYERTYLLYLFFFCVSAWNVNFRTIVKFFFWINLLFLVITILASIFGIIQNKVYTREEFDVIEAVKTQEIRPRYSFGYNYPTDFAAYFTYLNLMWWYLRRGVLKWIDYIPLLFSIWFVDHFCNARTEMVIMILIIICSLYYRFRVVRSNRLTWVEQSCFIFSVPLFAALMIFLEYLFIHSADEIIQFVDIALSGRLQLGADAFLTKGVKWFGQVYVQRGAGSRDYNYIDCQYLIWLIIYGIFTFVLAISVFVLICKRSISEREYLIAIIVSVLAIQNLIFPSFGLIKYCPFFMALLADISSHNYEKLNVRLVYGKVD